MTSYKLFPPRESLVSDIPAGDGNIKKLFTVYLCNVYFFTISTCQTASGKRQFDKKCQPVVPRQLAISLRAGPTRRPAYSTGRWGTVAHKV
jgi:hypothetical protein